MSLQQKIPGKSKVSDHEEKIKIHCSKH